MKMKYFTNINNLEELKKAYKKLCFKLHPDLGGNTKDFQEMSAEYEELFKILKKNNNNNNNKKTNENVKDYPKIVNILVKLGIDFDLVGDWIWIPATSKTYLIREKLSSIGFIYSKKKRKFWKDLTGNVKSKNKGYKSKKTYNQIKEIYGYKEFKGNKVLELEQF